MDDRTPSDPNEPGRPHQEVPVPDPHRGEPVPPANEGTRPEADPSVVRPDEDEPVGPVEGLVTAAGAKVEEEATPGGDPEAEALLAQMGVEEEGIEAGQLLGLMAATIAAVIALAVVLIFLFYEPFLGEVSSRMEDVEQYPELAAVRTDAAAKLTPYTRTDSTYSIPIERAMGLVAAEYEVAGDYSEAVVGMPETQAAWNTLPVMRGMGRAVETATAGIPAGTAPRIDDTLAPLDPGQVPPPDVFETGEEVGVDEPEETIPDDN